MIHLGYSGPSKGMTADQIRIFESWLRNHALDGPVMFHHGDCIGGDAQAHAIAAMLRGVQIHIHPPINESKRAFCYPSDVQSEPKEYLPRNDDIISASEELFCAVPTDSMTPRSGPWYVVKHGKDKGRIVFAVNQRGLLVT